MIITTAIKDIMKKRGVTQNELKEKLGYRTQSAIAERLKQKSIGVDKAFEMLDAMGYEIIIQPKSTRGKRATGSYVITKEDEQEEEK